MVYCGSSNALGTLRPLVRFPNCHLQKQVGWGAWGSDRHKHPTERGKRKRKEKEERERGKRKRKEKEKEENDYSVYFLKDLFREGESSKLSSSFTQFISCCSQGHSCFRLRSCILKLFVCSKSFFMANDKRSRFSLKVCNLSRFRKYFHLSWLPDLRWSRPPGTAGTLLTQRPYTSFGGWMVVKIISMCQVAKSKILPEVQDQSQGLSVPTFPPGGGETMMKLWWRPLRVQAVHCKLFFLGLHFSRIWYE